MAIRRKCQSLPTGYAVVICVNATHICAKETSRIETEFLPSGPDFTDSFCTVVYWHKESLPWPDLWVHFDPLFVRFIKIDTSQAIFPKHILFTVILLSHFTFQIINLVLELFSESFVHI